MPRPTLAAAALAATAPIGAAPAHAQQQELTAPELNILPGATYGSTNGLQLSQIVAEQAPGASRPAPTPGARPRPPGGPSPS